MMDILTPSLHSGYNKFKPNKASSTTATSIENIAPPSPRDSVDDERSVKEEEEDVDDMIINTTMKHTVTFPYQSPSFISFSEDPSFYLTITIQSLIYWEYPLKSALVLSMILGSTWLTQYYSLLYMVSSLFTIVTFINFIYVNMDYHSQRILTGKPTHTIHHPHSQKLNTSSRRTWLNEEQVNHGCQVMIQLLEGVLEEIIDIVLIQDNVKSGYAIFISFGVWLVANACSMKTMIFLGTLISFSFPRIYLEHHEAIDLFILQQKEKLYQTIASTNYQIYIQKLKECGQSFVDLSFQLLLSIYQTYQQKWKSSSNTMKKYPSSAANNIVPSSQNLTQ